MKTEFFRGQYEFELKQREHLSSSLSTPLTIVTLLGGVFAFLAHHAPSTRGVCFIVFTAALGASVICFCIALYAIYRANSGYVYELVADSGALRDWYNNLRGYFDSEEHAD